MTRAATTSMSSSPFQDRLRRFWKLSLFQKYVRAGQHLRRFWPSLPIPIRLPFGAWWIARSSALDYELLNTGFETAELRFVQRFLRPGMTVLDVGAHHGLYTLLASRLSGSTGKVIAFEPSPRERKRLVEHLRRNGLREVQVEPYALGAKPGEAKLYLTDSFNDWCNSLRPPADGADQIVTVPVRTLDDVTSQFKLNKIDLLKLDIEGGELDALIGAEKTLTSTDRPVILIEVQDHRTAPWGHKGVDVIRFLEKIRYEWATISSRGFLQKMNNESDKYDGNFVAIPSEKSDEILKELQPRDTP